jgi:carbon storage regulator CsrA
MLVLTRRSQEAIRMTIGGKVIRVVVQGINQGRIRLGIEADQDVRIARDELPPDNGPQLSAA